MRRSAPSLRAGREDGALELPGGVVGYADVADLAGGDQVVEGLKSFFERRVRIPGVDLIEIDGFDPEALQARLHRPVQVGAPGPPIGWIVAHRKPGLGGNGEAVGATPGGQPPSDDLLRNTAGVHVGGVDERAARRHEVIEDGVGGGLVGFGPERHRSQPEHADIQQRGS